MASITKTENGYRAQVSRRGIRKVKRFKTKDEEAFYNFPATGHFYTFEEHKIEHGVFNGSDMDRYALIFTVTNIENMKEWDREYYKNKMYWKAWSRGV